MIGPIAAASARRSPHQLVDDVADGQLRRVLADRGPAALDDVVDGDRHAAEATPGSAPASPVTPSESRPRHGGTVARMTDGILPAPVAALLDVALVSELTVIDGNGRPVTYPLIPLYDGRAIFMTSAVLFSRKLRHIKANPQVCVALTDPVGVPGRAVRPGDDPGRRPRRRGRPARRAGRSCSRCGGPRSR